jgi:hypothetical protein
MSLVKFKNPILKKIINVYQPKYKNIVAQGFGDYLRGCFCMFQICKMYEIEFDMDISNHPMAEFLLSNEEYTSINIDRNNISWFPNSNYKPTSPSEFVKDSLFFHNNFITHLNNIKVEKYFLFCNSFPVFNYIQDIARSTILSKITPIENLKKEVDVTMENMGLTRKNFSVIHIRMGDSYLLNNNSTLNVDYIQKIMKIVNPLISLNKKKYLILSDNNKIKYFFRKFPNCIYNIKSITHLGESGEKTREQIKNTLVDFYLMGQSNYIISVSPYNWGSGFSHWCSVLHKVPYKNFFIR